MKYINKFILSVLILILCLCSCFRYRREYFVTKEFDKKLFAYIEVENPYLKDKNKKIKWCSNNHKFMKTNWPNTFDHDENIKQDVINNALLLPKDYSIIDCGAHIGDGSIPIAHALKHNNRDDIIVYAIDPSEYKCKFIKQIAKDNNLNNIVVLNYGLSDNDGFYCNTNDINKSKTPGNSGGMEWKHNNNVITNINSHCNNFTTLDKLVKNKTINRPIGIIHLDIEGMEHKCLIGSKYTLKMYKPYLSIENNRKSGIDSNGNKNSDNNNYYLKFLINGYKYIKNINDNNIFKYRNR